MIEVTWDLLARLASYQGIVSLMKIFERNQPTPVFKEKKSIHFEALIITAAHTAVNTEEHQQLVVCEIASSSFTETTNLNYVFVLLSLEYIVPGTEDALLSPEMILDGLER